MPQRIVDWFDNPFVKVADVTVVGAAITSPWWRPILHEWSAVAADLAPIIGVLWIGVQIGCKVWLTAKLGKEG